MSSSEDQFNELLAQVYARCNKSLKESGKFYPMGILLEKNSNVEVLLAVDVGDTLSEYLNYLQDEMKSKVIDSDFVAACIVYPDFENRQAVVYLENNENYCLKVHIPVIAGELPKLDMAGMTTDDGGIYIFPVIDDS